MDSFLEEIKRYAIPDHFFTTLSLNVILREQAEREVKYSRHGHFPHFHLITPYSTSPFNSWNWKIRNCASRYVLSYSGIFQF